MLHTSIPAKETIQGNVPALVTLDVNYNDTGIASAVKRLTLIASDDRPVLLEAFAEVLTAFNATTSNVLTLGTTSTATELIDSSGITEGTAGFYPASNNVVKARLVANTPIYVKYAGSAAVAASGTLTSNNTNVSNNDTVTIGTKVYTFKTSLTPTEGEVLIGGSADASLLNLIRAINHTGTPDTDYKVAAANTQVSAVSSVTSHAFAVTALTAGTAGNSIAITETAVTLSWGAATLASGANGASAGKAKFYLRITPLIPNPSSV